MLSLSHAPGGARIRPSVKADPTYLRLHVSYHAAVCRLGLVVPHLHNQHDRRRVPCGASKDNLDAELEATQKTLDKVLQAVQATQAAQQQQVLQQQQLGASGSLQEATLVSRDQQLWDRQQVMLDRMQQLWDAERQVWLDRERQLLSELTQLRQELKQLMLDQHTINNTAGGGGGAAAAAAPLWPTESSVASSPAAAAEAAQATGASSPPAAAPAASLAAGSQPGSSLMPGQAKISGPSTASAAVAAAIRAVRDQDVEPAAASSSGSGGEGSAGSSPWQDLFSSSASRGVDSVAAAIAAVDTADVLADMDLSYKSTARGRRRTAAGLTTSSSSSSEAAAEADSSSNGSSEAAAGSSGSSEPDEDVSSSSSSVAAVEVAKGDPSGPPPLLCVGDDDIYWVAQLHEALTRQGFYPSDDEVENWLFAEGTQSALLTFQACNGLQETGLACDSTWRKLLGEDEYQAAYGHLTSSNSTSTSTDGSSSNGSNGSSAGSLSAVLSAGVGGVETIEAASGEVITYSFTSSSTTTTTTTSSSSSGSSQRGVSGGWPVLMDMDGGREVHAMQVALGQAGFHCGDDEMRWWQFGSSTMDALKTFQACSGLPESGVCDERTWRALLGEDAAPQDLDQVRGDESMYEDDMAAPHEGAVWLLGEQRWSRPVSE